MTGLATLLRHPEVATRSCESCKLWQYDDSGKIAERRGKPLKRIGPTPCGQCPKKSPEQAHEYELSSRNLQAVEFYYLTRAMNGLNLSDELKRDAIVQRNISIIDRIVKPHEAEQAASAGMAPLIAAMTVVPQTGRRARR